MGNGSVYEGSFVDGEIEGKGVRTWPDGTRYCNVHRIYTKFVLIVCGRLPGMRANSSKASFMAKVG
jgi:hypothetical protein